jgi:hypothetical protein
LPPVFSGLLCLNQKTHYHDGEVPRLAWAGIIWEQDMQTLRRALGLSLFGLLIAATVGGRTQEPAPPGKINLKVIKYDALAQEVQRHKGKVVVVDAWGIF